VYVFENNIPRWVPEWAELTFVCSIYNWPISKKLLVYLSWCTTFYWQIFTDTCKRQPKERWRIDNLEKETTERTMKNWQSRDTDNIDDGVSHKKQELLSLREYLGSQMVYGEVRVFHLISFLCFVLCLLSNVVRVSRLSILHCSFGCLCL
jgi:hypothetical protein